MHRNFDHRIEELWDIMQIQMKDNVKARLLGPDNMNHYRKQPGGKHHRAQFEIHDYYRKKHGK